jgi:hypothetical protein
MAHSCGGMHLIVSSLHSTQHNGEQLMSISLPCISHGHGQPIFLGGLNAPATSHTSPTFAHKNISS